MSIFDFDIEKELEKLPEDEQEIGYGTGVRVGIQAGMRMGLKLGGLKMLFELVQEQTITVAKAAKKAGLTTAAFKEEMKEAGYSVY